MILSLLLSSPAFADGSGLFDDPQETTTETQAEAPPATVEPVQTEPTQPTQEAQQTQQPIGEKTLRLILGNTKAVVNGQEVTLSSPAQSINGRTYLPMRLLTENLLGVSPSFDSKTGKITIKTSDTTAVLTLDKKEATVNSKKVALEAAPITRNNTTLLPLNFFVKYFNLSVSYDPAKKEVVVKEKILDANPPVADLAFSKESFVQGEPIEYRDMSSDADGDTIIARQFALASAPGTTNADIGKLLEKTAPGTHEILYRVQSSKKAWSQWISKPFVLEPNAAPTVSNLRVSKTDIGRGEAFEILYLQDNEPWEMITETLWTYRHESQDPSKALTQKPLRFFSAGNYIVTLQLKDAFGNLSEVYELPIQVSERIVQTQLSFLASGAGFVNTQLENYGNANYLDVFSTLGDLTFEDTPGLLIMSDSPENVFEYGILYRDTIPAGRGRLLTYHVNKIAAPKNTGAGVIVIVENLDQTPLTFRLEKTGMKGPSPDPHEVGGKVLDTHFAANSPWSSTTIEVGKSAIVYDSRSSLNWKPNNLISMLSEFESSGQAKITIAAVGPNTKLEHLSMLPALARDQHPRGTFHVITKSASVNVPGRVASGILLGKDQAEWVSGTDGITGEVTYNKGNYGVEYKITVTPAEDTLMFVNCRGGAFRGFVGWPDGINRTVSSYGPHDARYLGKIPGGQSTTIRYMLANGSASPVKIGFVPQSMWNTF